MFYELDNEQAYEVEVNHCVGVTGYHHWFFLHAIAEALHLDFRAFAVDCQGQRLGVVPLLFRRRGPVSTVNNLPIGYVGPLIREDALRSGLLQELLKGVQPILRSYRTVATRWAFAAAVTVDMVRLAAPEFKVEISENYVISGDTSVEVLLKSMSRSRRQAINRSLRKFKDRGVTVEDSSAEEVTQWLPTKIIDAYERQGLPPLYKAAEVQCMAERLFAHPRMLWRTAKSSDGDVLGLAGCIIGEERVWGWLMAGIPITGISPQILCYWDLIKWSLDRGLALDLGGAPNEGIRELKISLGADTETVVAALHIRHKRIYNSGIAIVSALDGVAGLKNART